MKRIVTIILFLGISFLGASQSLLVIVNADSKIYVDGEEKGKVKANDALKINVSKGDHYIQAKGKWNGQESEVNKTMKIESDDQTIVHLDFKGDAGGPSEVKIDSGAVKIADLSFSLPGTLEVNEWKNSNPGKEFKYPEFYYAFEKGDEIVLNYRHPGSNATNEIIVYSYPGKEIKYSNKSFTDLNNIHIKIEERSIYIFKLATNHLIATNGELIISRLPESEASKNFNTNVDRVKKYIPISVQQPQELTVHSETYMQGSNKAIIPIALPSNTVMWFYKFGASRNKDDMNRIKSGLKLLDELSSLCGTEGKILSAGVDVLATPPGTDNCDVYLLDGPNHVAFSNNTAFQYFEDGSRKGLNSGKVQVKNQFGSQELYLGFSNPSTFYSVNIAVEVVAIIRKEELVMEQQ
jgi:hypothetical protein